MNFDAQSAVSFCRKIILNKACSKLVVAAPCVYLSLLSHLFPKISFAAQDVSAIDVDYGAYTGEVSAYMLRSINAQYAVIGHYERRKFFGENNGVIIKKAQNCIKHNIIPIICFGEAKIGDDPIMELADLNDKLSSEAKIIYAYEPYWAIGTGEFQFETVNANITKAADYLNGSNKSLIYGGSVSSANISLLNTLKVDGFLVGGAALKVDELLKIIHSV